MGEVWCRDVWFQWICAINAFTWDRDLDHEDHDFMSEWFRALFHDGKSAGFTDFEKR